MSNTQFKAQVDKLLTNVSVMTNPEGHVADDILPVLNVKQYTGLIGKYGDSHFRIVDDVVTGKSEVKRVDSVSRTTTTYNVTSHALAGLVTKRDYANVEEPFEAESDEVVGITTAIKTIKEKAVADVLFSTSIITQNASPSNKYNSFSNSDPFVEIALAHSTILRSGHAKCNAAILPQQVMDFLQYHPEILSRLGFSQNRAGLLSYDDMKQALKVDYLFVPSAVANTAKEGVADSLGQIWSDSILFYHRPAAAAKYQNSLGYQVRIAGQSQQQVYKNEVKNPPGSTEIIVESEYSFEIVNPRLAFLINDVLSV
jgi:hypothetical protein